MLLLYLLVKPSLLQKSVAPIHVQSPQCQKYLNLKLICSLLNFLQSVFLHQPTPHLSLQLYASFGATFSCSEILVPVSEDETLFRDYQSLNFLYLVEQAGGVTPGAGIQVAEVHPSSKNPATLVLPQYYRGAVMLPDVRGQTELHVEDFEQQVLLIQKKS
jgi:hypothetical protein